MQSAGHLSPVHPHSWVLQDCVSLLPPVQATPPLAACTVTLRNLRCTPPPQDLEHSLKEPQLPQAQFTGIEHGWMLQNCVLVELPVHGAPPSAAWMAMLRVRVCIPPSQDFEQGPKDVQSVHAQSTFAHAMELQNCEVVVEPWHGAPPWAAGIRMWRLLLCVPPPHSLEQGPNKLQVLQTQFVFGHAWVLQDCELVLVPVHGAPP